MRNHNGRTTQKFIIGALTLLLSASVALAQKMSGGKYTINSAVVGSGGGTSTGAGNKLIEGTAGQNAAGGPHTQSNYSHDAGFWSNGSTASSTPTPTPTPAGSPAISISDVNQAEGNSGTSSFTFTVSLSAASSQTVTVVYTTSDGSAASASDYQGANGLIIFNPGETTKPVIIMVNGDSQMELNETFAVDLSGSVNASLQDAQGIGTIINDDNVSIGQLQFSQSSYSVSEDLTAMSVTVIRTGDVSGASSVSYQSVNATASDRSDFEYAGGRLNFAPGETSKTFQLLINEDMYTDQNESLTLTLSNPVGAVLGPQSTITVVITDDVPESPGNPIDDAESFVHMHYHDFLNREPDAAGLAFWTGQITACGTDQQCIDAKRVNVSAAFFLSIEYQETGYLVHRMYKAAYGNLLNSSVPMRANELLTDTQAIGQGLVVNQSGWQQLLEGNKQTFALDFVQRTRFFQAFPNSMSPTQLVDTLFTNAGIIPSANERQAAINEFAGASNTTDESARARTLRRVAENQSLKEQEFNRAFVLMQYIGYLRRNPVDNPEPSLNYDGYNFWLNKLNVFNGDYEAAEMVKAFIISSEYRQRFGP